MKIPDITTRNISFQETEFDMTPYSDSALKLDMRIMFKDSSPEKVFQIMGDPALLKDWYLLVENVHMHPPKSNGESDFDVDFALFGRVHEEILYWDEPNHYVYKATGNDFPIKDYVALIEVQENGPNEGVMIWRQYFDEIEGSTNQRLLPVILPAINEFSLKRLAKLIGGYEVKIESHF
jgi:hypothetical protein